LGALVAIGYSYSISPWTWVQLLIVPAAIAGVGIWFNAQQREREQHIANERAQDEALQAYLNQMSQLLLDKDKPLRQSQKDDEARTLARARTVTVLGRLDGSRKRSLVEFLLESGLIGRPPTTVLPPRTPITEIYALPTEGIISLSAADLRGADLQGIEMSSADLRGAILSSANLQKAYLQYVKFSAADLRGANLHHAQLLGAALYHVDLSGADLSDADLTDATGVSNEQLEQQASSLEGATMPNGQKYENTSPL
jgi:uncharacterized protein YjbI with pentapeptide repeats